MPANWLCSLPLRTAAARGAGRAPEGQKHPCTLPRRWDRAPPLPRRPVLPLLLPGPARTVSLVLANARSSLHHPACKGSSAWSPSSGQQAACSPRLARAVTLEKPVIPLDEDVIAPNEKGQGLQQPVWQPAVARHCLTQAALRTAVCSMRC